MFIRTLKEAKEIAGNLGQPDKMPQYAYGLPANEGSYVEGICKERGWPVPPKNASGTYGCGIGSKLSKCPDSPCFNCYADERGNYTWPSVHINRTKHAVAVHHPMWKYAMHKLIKHYVDPSDPHFRWLDSGDVVNEQMLLDIIWLAEQLPRIKFWLPTQERKIVWTVLHNRGLIPLPDNLCIRISSTTKNKHYVPIGDYFLTVRGKLCSSSVSTTGDHDCPSEQYNNTCGRCRLCWDTSHLHTIYKEH
jgi:hypothetical protein